MLYKEWVKLIEEFKESGKSQAQSFSKAVGMSDHVRVPVYLDGESEGIRTTIRNMQIFIKKTGYKFLGIITFRKFSLKHFKKLLFYNEKLLLSQFKSTI